MKHTTSDLDWLTQRPIAHRGLHDGNRAVAENSMAAFRAAAAQGFAIECDVHIAADGVPVVFHDESLARMTGLETPLASLSSAELADLRLAGTSEGIPPLSDLLTLAAGTVPLVIELKGSKQDADRGFAGALANVLADYSGPLALMSFDEWLVDQALGLGRRFPVGLTAEGMRAETLSQHRAIFSRGCAFTSYNVHHLPNDFVEWVRKDRHLPVISWTVRTPEDIARSAAYADQMTFEGFVPEIKELHDGHSGQA